jgi:hypothetical protein
MKTNRAHRLLGSERMLGWNSVLSSKEIRKIRSGSNQLPTAKSGVDLKPGHQIRRLYLRKVKPGKCDEIQIKLLRL